MGYPDSFLTMRGEPHSLAIPGKRPRKNRRNRKPLRITGIYAFGSVVFTLGLYLLITLNILRGSFTFSLCLFLTACNGNDVPSGRRPGLIIRGGHNETVCPITGRGEDTQTVDYKPFFSWPEDPPVSWKKLSLK